MTVRATVRVTIRPEPPPRATVTVTAKRPKSGGSSGGSGQGDSGSGSDSSGGLDPRFDTCSEANSAGYGPYTQGIDREYDWYIDRDGDGVDCEP